MIQNILVTVDGSESADKALDLALDLAEKYSANLVLLNAVHATVPTFYYTPEVTVTISSAVSDIYFKELRASHVKMLVEALKKAKNLKPDLNVSKKLEEGRPLDKIIETAKVGNFDLIVMGHRGLSGIKEFVLGSVSDRVAHDAACPVLIVK